MTVGWTAMGQGPHPRCLEEIEAQVQLIAENRMLGHDAGLPIAGLRQMNSGRHAVFYLVLEDRIEIVRVLHGASDLERWL